MRYIFDGVQHEEYDKGQFTPPDRPSPRRQAEHDPDCPMHGRLTPHDEPRPYPLAGLQFDDPTA